MSDTGLDLLIPTIAKSIYSIRNKRDAVHINEIDPSYIDAQYIVIASSWILAELLRIICFQKNLDKKIVIPLIEKIMSRKYPFIQEIDGRIVILKENLTCSDHILTLLYITKNSGLSRKQISEQLLNYFSQSSLSNSLKKLINEKMVVKNNDIYKITLKGIKYIENKLKGENNE